MITSGASAKTQKLSIDDRVLVVGFVWTVRVLSTELLVPNHKRLHFFSTPPPLGPWLTRYALPRGHDSRVTSEHGTQRATRTRPRRDLSRHACAPVAAPLTPFDVHVRSRLRLWHWHARAAQAQRCSRSARAALGRDGCHRPSARRRSSGKCALRCLPRCTD